MLTALEINDELLWNLVQFKLDFIDFNVGVIGKLVYQENHEYGYKESTPPSYFYIENSTVNYVKPLVSFGLGINLFFMDVRGYGEITPIAVSEHTEGDFLYSIDNIKKTFTTDDNGFDSTYGGKVSLDFNVITLGGGIEYFRHIGYSRKYSGTDFIDYVYELVDLSYSINVKLDFLKFTGSIPTIGVSIIENSFNPVQNISGLAAYKKTRYRIDIGVGLSY
jgi:hypothetical protein